MHAPAASTARFSLAAYIVIALLFFAGLSNAPANIPGGGTGTSAAVTLTSTATTATMGNGVVSILCTKAGATINQINYTYNNGSGSTTTQLLSGGHNGGQLYWELGGFGGNAFTYSVVVDPAAGDATHARGDYAEIALLSSSTAAGAVDVHFSMRRGSPGFYVTAIWSHRAADTALGMGETRTNIYAGTIFNWMSVDAARNKLMEVFGGTAIAAPLAPVECSLWTNGIYAGLYEDKYKFSANLGTQRVWGWSSVGSGGKNVGLWDVSASAEYYNGGPMKPELMCHIGTTILNMFNGSHYGMGTDSSFVAGEVWAKVYGPYFVYCNNVASTLTDPVQASQALYNDALAQGVAEAGAWPYGWFVNANYSPAASRGTVTGRMLINDVSNPNASAANLWVGLIKQPVTSTGTYDFQQWMKPYQFWVKTDASGNFSLPDVIAGSGYTLYAFGPGAIGTFLSQAQTGGNPPLLYNVAATPFAVSVTGGGTSALGTVTWTPSRVGPTVFEIGWPDRTGRKFRHGEDYWVGDRGPSPTSPSAVWTKFLEYPFDFPSGPNYLVGTSRWTTDWNFCQPVVVDGAGNWNGSTSTLTFNLATAPAAGAQGSIYLGLCSDYYGPMIVSVNGTNLGSASGVTSTPGANSVNGYFPAESTSDTTIRESINGAFSDERLTFPGTLLKAGTNTIKINMRKGGYFANHAMYDYVRLELTGYIPPAPAAVTAYPGVNRILVSWPVSPGATSYKLLRTSTSGSGYTSLASGILGPVCGSGPENATYADTSALNGTTYYYVVQAVNPTGTSVSSAQSNGVAPSAGAPASAPAAPAGLSATAASGKVSLNWTAPAGANLYTIQRSTLVANGGGTYTNLGTITLSNNVSGTSYADTTPTNGSTYSYSVLASNAVGTGSAPAAVTALPLAVAPSAAPASLTVSALQSASAGNIALSWPAVAGATGYVVQRAPAAAGPYTFLYSVSTTSFTDTGLPGNTPYFYQVAALNSGGTSAFIGGSDTTPPDAPVTVTATGGSARVRLDWSASPGATSYLISRSTLTGGPYTAIKSAVDNLTYLDGSAANGTAYFYVITALGAGGTGTNSVEATATPALVPSLTWKGGVNTSWDATTANWLNGATASVYANGQAVLFDDTASVHTAIISGTLTPNDVQFNHSTDYTVTAAGLSGATSVTKRGTGTLNLSGINSFSGGTIIQAGSIALMGGTANAQNGLGTGLITLDGGALVMNGYSGANTTSYGTFANDLSVPTASIGTFKLTQRGAFSGDVIGGGTLTLAVNDIRADLSGDWSKFRGQINVIRTRTGTSLDQLRFASNPGFGTAAVDLGPYVQALTTLNAANTLRLGQLSGNASARLAGIVPDSGVPGNFTVTYAIGGRDTDATFAGAITNGTAPSLTAIQKEGAGTWTLSGSNSYTGATVLSAGTLNVSGSLANTSSLTVSAGSTLLLNGGIVSVSGAISNQGVIRLTGTGSLSSMGAFTNTGVLDLINGPRTLPANFLNKGVVIDSRAVAVSSIKMGANATCILGIAGYAGHTYQLQSTPSLSTPNWLNIGAAQSVPGTQTGTLPLTLSDPAATTPRFYRVAVTPAP